MRIVLASVLVVLLCCTGYGVAFQQPPSGERFPATNAPVLRSPPSRVSPVETAREAIPRARADRYVPAGQVSYTLSTTAPVVLDEPAAQPSQMAVVISKSGLRFLSPRAGFDIDEIDLQPESLIVVCNSADVTTDAQGKTEVICQDAAVIKTADLGGKANRLRYKSGLLVLEGDDSDSLIARNKGDKTVFLLRAKTISVDLNTQQIEASDGSKVQLKREPQPPEAEKSKPNRY